MNTLKHLALLTAGLLAAWGAFPAAAQTNVDSTQLGTVSTAVTNTLAVNSLTIQVQSQTVRADQTDPTQQSTLSAQAVQGASGWNVSGALNSISRMRMGDAAATETTLTLEYVSLDGTTYVRFTQVPEAWSPQGLPQDWTDAAQLTQMGPMLSGIPSAGSLPAGLAQLLALPLDSGVVTALTELSAEAIDGQAMRVFQLTLDPTAVASSDAAGLLMGMGGGAALGGGPGGPGGDQTGGGPGGNGQPPSGDNGQQPQAGGPGGGPGGNGQPPSGDANGQPPAGGQNGERPAGFGGPGLSAENTQLTVTFWMGEDGLVHRAASSVVTTPTDDAAGGPMGTGSATTTTADLFGFNEQALIVAP